MIGFEFSLPDGDSLTAQLSVYPEIFAKEINAAMLEAGLLLEREVKERTPVGVGGAGGLRGNISAITPYMQGDSLIGGVASSLPYAVSVELGTKPHFPPVQPLADWVRAKLGESNPTVAQGIAFCIARKIAKHGTEGKFMFKEALEATEDIIAAIFDRAVERTLSGAGGSHE